MRYLLVSLSVIVAVSAGSAVSASKNLVTNGSFENGTKGWGLHDGRPKFVSMGRGSVVRDHVHEGKAAYLYEKTVPEKWYPQLWTLRIPIKAGGYYEASAMVDTREGFVFRHTFLWAGGGAKFHTDTEPTQGWKRVKIRFRAPKRIKSVMLGFMMSGHAGKVWIDDVRLEETEPFDDVMPGVMPSGPPADRIHRLVELSTRTRIKPFELVQKPDGAYPSERVVFKDTATGATIWRMSRNPGYNRHHYSNMPVWNADGSKLVLRSNRDTRNGHWQVEADGSQWAYFPKRFGHWNPTNPDIAYSVYSATGEIWETNIRTGKQRVLWKLPVKRFYLTPPSKDGKKFLVTENPQSRTAERSYFWLLNTDGIGEPQRFDAGTVAHQTWFLKRDDYAFMFNDEVRNQKNKYQDKQWMCEPARGGAISVFHRRHLGHAGVSPSGKRVAHHRGGIRISEVDTGKTWLSMAGGGGHLSWECDDRWLVATMGNNIYEVWVDERRARRVCVPNTQLGYSTYYTEAHLESSPDGTKIGYASSMMGDCDFYVAVQRLPDPSRNVRLQGTTLTWDPPERRNEVAGYHVYRGAKALTREPVRECRFGAPQANVDYTVTAIEPSGLESAREDKSVPSAPTSLKAAPRSPYAVELSWQAPDDLDLSYFNVYASSEERPGPDQRNRIASPTEPRCVDWGLQAGTTYQYVITAVDRAGNESSPTSPVTVGTPPIDRFIRTIKVGRALSKNPIPVDFSVPTNDAYALWAELKAKKVSRGQSLRHRLDDGPNVTWRPAWDFVCKGHGDPNPVPFFDTVKVKTDHASADPRVALKAGTHRLSLALPSGSAELVSLTVTNDLGYMPKGITSFLTMPAKR